MRITTSASGIVRGERAGVQLNSCWAILPEVEMQTDLPSRAPDLLKRAFSLFKERHRSRPVKREDYSVHRRRCGFISDSAAQPVGASAWDLRSVKDLNFKVPHEALL
ncbi:unnamed protein product [Rangifer tarandus platyrhynchus]|uniref:Uncharacterized protein n=1 Tax=Rangifer tarandus platyrhynchus TaxID=3082113 RepID=A0ACB1MJN1_RANTA